MGVGDYPTVYIDLCEWVSYIQWLYSLTLASALTMVSKKGIDTILLVVFHCILYGWVNTVNVFKEVLLVIFLLDDKCVIHIP